MIEILLIIIALTLFFVGYRIAKLHELFIDYFHRTGDFKPTTDENDGDYYDELYDQAKRIVIQAQACSASFLQRHLKIGYARAARLVDQLEKDKIVSPIDPDIPLARKVLVRK